MPNSTLLAQLNLPLSLVAGLPPEIRDGLLAHLQTWGEPDETLAVVDALRTAHGPLLFLLDVQAAELLRANHSEQALEVVERRQRRSTTAISQALEARALLATGHHEHARQVAEDLVAAYPRNATVIAGAALVLAQVGQFEPAVAALEKVLAARQGDVTATLAMAQIQHRAGRSADADLFAQRLGAGVPPSISDEQLGQLAALVEQLGKEQSAQALRTELERRRLMQREQLARQLTPFVAGDPALAADSSVLYHRLNGPESLPMSGDERKRVSLEAIRHFGFGRLRSGQAETIAAVLRGESILTVMPTGAGKSLCYQLPALVMPRATLVISPLIALMKDQVESLPHFARTKATFINSTLSDAELDARMAGIARGEYKLIYAAPERLRQRTFLRVLRRAGLDLFVVDEAHCVSMWGHDFRPDYLFIAEARHELGDPPALAMTATAPPRVRDEIIDYISADAGSGDALAEPPVRPRVLTLDIFRNNLHLSALEFHNEDEKMGALLQFAAETPGSGIVYVNSRHKAETLAFALREAGVAAEAYHAGLADRGPVQDRFMSDKTRVVVATIAFGMGIDKADIRFIVHFHPSRSLDAYYQEVGRAGRDGKPSQGVLFFSTNDWSNMRRWARSDEYNSDFLVRVYNAVAGQLGVSVPATPGEPAPEEVGSEESSTKEVDVPRPVPPSVAPQFVQEPGSTDAVTGSVDARRLQQVLNADETEIRVAISLLERADLLTRGFDIPHELGVTLPDRIPEVAKADRRFARFLKGLRLGPAQAAAYATGDIARFLKCSHEDAEQQLLDWQDQSWIQVKGNRRTMLIELPPRPVDLRERLERLLQQTTALSQRRIDDVIGYATTESCRHGYISAHFGSPPRLRCTVCDVCTGIRPDLPVPERIERQAPDDSELVPMLLDCLISLPRPVGRSGLARILAGNLRAPVGPDKARHFGRLKGMGEEALVTYIDDLLADGRLRQYERQGYPVLAPTARGRMEAEAWLGEHPELGALGEPLAQSDEIDGDTPAEADKYTALQKQIWRWRRQMADSQGQPAYVIMSNETMLRIAEARPRTLEELGSLPGMGERRKNAYGPVLLDLVLNNPPQAGDEALLAQQRDAPLAGEGSDADEKSAKARNSRPPIVSAPAVTPQQERKIATRLEEMRLKRAIARRLKPFEVASSPLMREIARRGPMTLEELQAVPGFAASPFHEDAQTIVDFVVSLRRPPV